MLFLPRLDDTPSMALEGQEAVLSCEESLTELHRIREQLVAAVGQMDAYAREYLDLMRERPLLLVGGEMELLQRLAGEVKACATEHQRALDAYRQLAIMHEDGAPPPP